MAPSLVVAPGRPFVHLSFHLADLGGEAVEPNELLNFSFYISWDHVKPSPRSHRRSLAKTGERWWRRGRASIPLVNLSERISSSIDCDPWLVVTASRKHGPGDASEFVGERYRQQIAMREAFGGSFDPRPQSPHRCGRPPYQHDVGGLNEQRPEISVTALGDLAELGAIASRLLLGYQTEPSAKIAALTEAAAIADRGRLRSC